MFQDGVTSTDDALIEGLFGVSTPGADDLLGGAKKEEKEEKQPAAKPAKPVAAAPVTGEVAAELSEETIVDALFEDGEDPKAPAKPLDGKKPGPKPTAKLPESTEVNYEAIYNDMVNQGLWDEVDIPEEIEWNKDTFLQIQKLQASSKVEDLLSKTGPIGKQIIEFEQNGGNPRELLEMFREQKEVQEFDISDVEGQETFLRSYLESQGNSERSIERTIAFLKDQGGSVLQEEAEEKKGIWDAQYKEVIEARKKEQILAAKQLEEAQRNFQKNITDTLISDTEATPRERKELQNYMLNYSQQYNGRQVSQFYIDMAEVQKDPKNYVELAKMVKGLKNGEYTKKVADKAKKETAVSNYLKIKGGAALANETGSTLGLSSDSGSNFLTLLRKKNN